LSAGLTLERHAERVQRDDGRARPFPLPDAGFELDFEGLEALLETAAGAALTKYPGAITIVVT